MEEDVLEEQIVEKIDYTEITNKYRTKLINKISIIFTCSFLVFGSRWIVKYQSFDIIRASLIFQTLLICTLGITISTFVYILFSKRDIVKEETSKIYKKLLSVFDIIIIIPIFMALISLSNAFVISPATVIGQSMEPSYYEGQDIFMWHLTSNYERFDVVVLKTDNNEFYLKRIIGLPGDYIIIDHNVIKINGDVISQKFLENDLGSIEVYTYCNISNDEFCEFDVPQNSYFVMGDNREHSLDSRSDLLGFVHEDKLYGIVILKINNIFRDIIN